MRADEAIAFIRPALPGVSSNGAASWADVGAGAGTFTRALASCLGAAGTVHAIDRDRVAMQRLSLMPRTPGHAAVITHAGDVAEQASWTALALPPLDGVLIANTLHFIPSAEQPAALQRLASALKDDGRLLVIEYENRAANRWVPYPIAFEALSGMIPTTLSPPVRIASRPSAFGGSMYLALMRRT